MRAGLRSRRFAKDRRRGGLARPLAPTPREEVPLPCPSPSVRIGSARMCRPGRIVGGQAEPGFEGWRRSSCVVRGNDGRVAGRGRAREPDPRARSTCSDRRVPRACSIDGTVGASRRSRLRRFRPRRSRQLRSRQRGARSDGRDRVAGVRRRCPLGRDAVTVATGRRAGVPGWSPLRRARRDHRDRTRRACRGGVRCEGQGRTRGAVTSA